MQLVEHHRISRSDPRFAALDAAAFASKNLFNLALYTTRQAYIFRGELITYPRLAKELRTHETYRALPAKVSQWVLKQVCAAWDSFFAARAAYARDPSRFVSRPRLPQYKAFVSIPFARLIQMLTYKAELLGIRVLTHDEASTSKCSFFDGEPVGKRSTYAGKRVHRGLFRTASGRRVNADINAAYNQIANVAPDAFGPGRRGCVVQPGRIALPNRQAVR